MEATSQSSLVERDSELAVIRAALDAAQDGNGSVVSVEGEAGTGKTAVLAELREQAEAGGLTVLSARGADLERDFPFGVLGTLLRPALGAAAPDERAQLLAGTATPIRTLLGLDPDATRPVEPSAALLESVFWVVDGLCAAGPLVLCVDDAHWVDGASLRALAYVAGRADSLALVLALGRRTGEAATDEAALRSLSAAAGDARLTLASLSRDGCATVASARGAGRLASDDLTTLHAVTGGNPLLVAQVAETVARSGDVAISGPVGKTTITEIVRRRLLDAPEATHEVARAVAILGDGAPIAQLAAYTGLEPAAVADAAVALDDRGIFAADEACTFTHPLVAEAVLADLSTNALGLAHLRAAGVLRDTGATPTQIAGQLLRSPATGDALAVRDLRAAAAAARARATPEIAVALLRRAVTELPGDPGPGLRTELGLAEQAAGDFVAAWEHLEPTVRDPAAPGELALAAALSRALHGGFGEGVDALCEAARVRDAVAPDDALGLRGAAAYFCWFLPAALRPEVVLPSGSALSGETRGQRMALAGLTARSVGLGAVAAQTLPLARAALSDGRFAADSAVAMDCTSGPLLGLLYGEDLERAGRELAHIESTALVRPWPGATVSARLPLSYLLLLRGETAAAIAEAEALLDLRGALGDAFGVRLASFVCSFLVLGVLRHEGHAAAEARLEALGYAGELPFEEIFALPARGHVRMALGRPEEALADALVWREAIGAMGDPMHPIEFHTLEPLARLACGDHEGAAAVSQRELGRARTWGAPGRIAAHLRVEARINPDQAVPLLEEAVALARTSPLRAEQAHALVDLGIALRRAGRRSDAREALEQGVQAAASVQAHTLAERGVEELRVLGARPRRLAFSGADALTASERRVADLAAAGATNREIAQHLFVTVKTVDSHLMRAYRKLGISSRRDLPAVLDAA